MRNKLFLLTMLFSVLVAASSSAAVIKRNAAVQPITTDSISTSLESRAAAQISSKAQETASMNTSNASTPLALHGALSVSGADLVDQYGKPFQLKGVSTHGIAWFPQYVNIDAFRNLRDNYGVNLVRLAMYTDEYGGYCAGGDKAALEGIIDKGVQAAYSLGIYVIIDWHVLHDENPLKYQAQAKDFFTRMSQKYAAYPNVLYEICNEPNGSTTWTDVKSYASVIIPAIRANASSAIILVGSPTWSQAIDQAAADPITGQQNIMYTLHFYAGTHKDDLRNRLVAARQKGLPVFISEFSICDASGNGGIDYSSAEAWKTLINQNNLSYAAWSLCNKAETASLLRPEVTSATGGWTDQDLSETGKWLKQMLHG